ncbi:MAG: hypothetical protein FJ271_05350 [Planctomycetes bacterium]|nr:hypothetical protein [Planctomycetota bacterium]
MSQLESNVASGFEVNLDLPAASKFERERRAFRRLLPKLLPTYRGQYVAVHNESVVDNGSNRLEVAMRVLHKVGNVDIYVGLVTDQVEPLERSGLRRELAAWRATP